MIRHCVMFKWADDATEEAKQAVRDGISGLPAAIPEVAAYAHGDDLGVGNDNHDYAVVGDFATVEDYRVYAEHPVHTKLVAEVIRPAIAGRAAVQYEL